MRTEEARDSTNRAIREMRAALIRYENDQDTMLVAA